MSILGADHILLSLLLVLLLGALFSDLLKVVDQTLHFVFADLFVGLDVVDHHVDSVLSLFELVLLCLFHVLLDGFGGLHAKVVLNYIHVFVDLSYFFVGIDEGQSEVACASHLLPCDSFGCKDSLTNNVFPSDVSNLSRDVGNSQLEDEVL